MWFSQGVWILCMLGASCGAPVASASEKPAAIELSDPERARALAVLRAGLASDEFWPSMHAAEALTLAGQGAEVLRALQKRKAADDQQRCGLSREAVRAGDMTQVGVLAAILANHSSNGRTHAAESLFKVSQLGDREALLAAYEQNTELKLKLMAAAALHRGKAQLPASATPPLECVRGFLEHEDREVRKVAAWILGQVGVVADVAFLRRALSKEPEELARAYIAHALACLGDDEGKRLLVQNLSSKNPAVRTYAADFAGPARAASAREKLVKLLDDEVLDVRVRAAQALLLLAGPVE